MVGEEWIVLIFECVCCYIVEFATIQLVNDKVKYDLYKPEQIDALLKEQNVGATATATSTETATA